jgi:hypothetical protein
LEPATAQPGRSLLWTLGWAVFVGCSWTWCIGMFLPVLLIRDLGIWGWIVFAVPNVIGAAAMGWALRTRERSAHLVHEHAAACLAFSIITIAFHVFFVLWFVPRLLGLPLAALTYLAPAVYLLMTAARPQSDLPAALVTFAISLAMLALFLVRAGHLSVTPIGATPSVGALWLAPVCILGFSLCPYLDLTFHRARQATDAGAARISFTLGFGICFFAMIIFSLLYAPVVAPLIQPRWSRTVLAPILAAHLIAQTVFTLAAHTRSTLSTTTRGGSLLWLFVVAQAAVFVGIAAWVLPAYHGMPAGELIYRLFMSFYGLVFPAYVWTCIVPGRDGESGVTPAKLRAMFLGVLVAAPMYWMGFIEGHFVWLVPGVAAVLLSRFTVPARSC